MSSTQKPFDPLKKADAKALEEKQKKLREIEERIKLREGLPFLFGWKWYGWAREFYDSTNKINLLCAANQISKSSTQIRKCINWATDQALWPALWGRNPVQFWYLYPTAKQATAEYTTKWSQFLPKGDFKNHPIYGWRAEIRHGEIHAIHFNSGVHLYFKSYAQDSQSLQTGTVDAIFCDEELPVDLYEELIFRISASDGYFHMVFTATMGQDFWRRAMEPEEGEKEELAYAWKKTVSMYDCLKYDDGTASHWTIPKIKMVEARCSTHNEILKRVHGKFIVDEGGRKYPQFDIKRHVRENTNPIPDDWMIYAGVDIGGGGPASHPSAIAFVGISPDFRRGRVFLGWRGDGITTTAGDVMLKFQELRDTHKLKITAQFYDFGSKDFETISSRMSEPFLPADKSHEKGEQIINVLFKHGLLLIDDNPELRKLAIELSTIRKDQAKNKAKDDFADALRYAITRAPWDFSALTGELPHGYQAPERPMTHNEREIYERRKAFQERAQEEDRLEAEFGEWNDLLDY
jgi:phage terminase large subunit-like protein